jgi:hypothetical protein
MTLSQFFKNMLHSAAANGDIAFYDLLLGRDDIKAGAVNNAGKINSW